MLQLSGWVDESCCSPMLRGCHDLQSINSDRPHLEGRQRTVLDFDKTAVQRLQLST